MVGTAQVRLCPPYETNRHCEERSDEAIHSFFAPWHGLLPPSPRLRRTRRFARNDEQTHLHDLAARFARGLLEIRRPLQTEGAGNAGCALHPRSRVQCAQEVRTRAYRFSGGNPTFPAQGKINSSVKFYEVACSSHPIDRANNIPITSHITSLDFPHTFGTKPGYKTWHAGNATTVWKAEPHA